MSSRSVPQSPPLPLASEKGGHHPRQEDHFDSPEFNAEVESHYMSLRGQRLAAAISFVAGTGFTLFGYDQGVMSSLLTTGQFEKTFPETVVATGGPNAPVLQSLLVAIYEVGCLLGALANIWIGDRLGRRRTIFWGGVIMMIGAILQTTPFSYSHMIVARIITGFGNGLNTSTVPSYHAETSPPERRGSLLMVEGSLITFGIMVSYWIDFAFFWANGSSVQWRGPIAIQIVFALIMCSCVFYLPESPRWLVKKNRNAEALAVISALADKPASDAECEQTFRGISESIAMETRGHALAQELEGKVATPQKSSLRSLLTHGPGQNFRRAALAITVQCFQQVTGINLITYYATLLFQRLGLSDVNSRILAAANGTEYFLASLVAIALIDRVGRRKLMLVCAAGQSITMALLAILGKINNTPAQLVSAVLLFVFNTFFAIGWLGMTWLYSAEIVGLSIRAPASALSTASNWTWNFVVVMITGPSFANIGYQTYIVFAALNAFIIPVVYCFCPETKNRSLEDMDVVFALAHKERGWFSPVSVSLRDDVPSAGSIEADEIMGVDSSMRKRANAGSLTTSDHT